MERGNCSNITKKMKPVTQIPEYMAPGWRQI